MSPSPLLRKFKGERVIKTYGLKARDVMTPKPHTVSESTSLAEIADLLESLQIKRVPVVRDGQVVGIVSRANLVQALASGQKSRWTATDLDKSIRDEVNAALAGQPWQTQLQEECDRIERNRAPAGPRQFRGGTDRHARRGRARPRREGNRGSSVRSSYSSYGRVAAFCAPISD